MPYGWNGDIDPGISESMARANRAQRDVPDIGSGALTTGNYPGNPLSGKASGN